MTELETLKQKLAALEAHAKGLDAANLKNQTELDRQLQLHVDKDAAHAAEIEKLKAAHAEYCRQKEQLHGEALLKQASDLTAKHEAFVAELKQKTLIPALRDLQKRQAADLAAKHEAELKAM